MKAKINNIEFEGTPEEFAEFLRLQQTKIDCSEKEEDDIVFLRRMAKSRSDKRRESAAVVNVLHHGNPVGTMILSELALLLGCDANTLRNRFARTDKIEWDGYTATMIKRGRPKNAFKLKVTDSKGDNRIFLSITDFCVKTGTKIEAFKWLRKKQPNGPWKINGYTVEKIN